jgi:hypothetical protein
MKIRIGVAGALFLSLGALFAGSLPAFGVDNGSVTATVNVQDVACVQITSSGITYGTKAFSTANTPVQGTGTITNLASCSTADQTVLVHGATATGTGATWSLVSALACPTPNQYVHEVDNPNTLGGFLQLASGNITFGSLAGNSSFGSIPTRLTMPCTGSNGAGQTMSTQIVFTATVP